MKLSDLIENGTISIEDFIAEAPEVTERARLVNDGLKACTKTLLFPLNVEVLFYLLCPDGFNGYDSVGYVSRDGIFSCFYYCDNEEIGRVNLNNPTEVFIALESGIFAYYLRKFLEQQIQNS